ncbi:MAG: hypothetical protein ACKOPC_04745, partial [Methylocystis sp.]
SMISGRCYSACVYALMGGSRRVIPPESRVGVHRMFNYSTNFDFSEGHKKLHDLGFIRHAALVKQAPLRSISK